MAKYHISESGEPKVCTAKIKCRLGGGNEHFDSLEEAQNYADKNNKKIASFNKRTEKAEANGQKFLEQMNDKFNSSPKQLVEFSESIGFKYGEKDFGNKAEVATMLNKVTTIIEEKGVPSNISIESMNISKDAEFLDKPQDYDVVAESIGGQGMPPKLKALVRMEFPNGDIMYVTQTSSTKGDDVNFKDVYVLNGTATTDEITSINTSDFHESKDVTSSGTINGEVKIEGLTEASWVSRSIRESKELTEWSGLDAYSNVVINKHLDTEARALEAFEFLSTSTSLNSDNNNKYLSIVNMEKDYIENIKLEEDHAKNAENLYLKGFVGQLEIRGNKNDQHEITEEEVQNFKENYGVFFKSGQVKEVMNVGDIKPELVKKTNIKSEANAKKMGIRIGEYVIRLSDIKNNGDFNINELKRNRPTIMGRIRDVGWREHYNILMSRGHINHTGENASYDAYQEACKKNGIKPKEFKHRKDNKEAAKTTKMANQLANKQKAEAHLKSASETSKRIEQYRGGAYGIAKDMFADAQKKITENKKDLNSNFGLNYSYTQSNSVLAGEYDGKYSTQLRELGFTEGRLDKVRQKDLAAYKTIAEELSKLNAYDRAFDEFENLKLSSFRKESKQFPVLRNASSNFDRLASRDRRISADKIRNIIYTIGSENLSPSEKKSYDEYEKENLSYKYKFDNKRPKFKRREN